MQRIWSSQVETVTYDILTYTCIVGLYHKMFYSQSRLENNSYKDK